jgi:hypothetical protein
VTCVEADAELEPVSVPAEMIDTPEVSVGSVLYSNSTVVAEPFGLTVEFRVAAVVVSTFVAASVLTVGEFASSAVKT